MRKKLTYNLWEQLGRAKEDREQSLKDSGLKKSSPQSAREQQKGGAVADDDDDGQSTISI